jgi:hypothetical protein
LKEGQTLIIHDDEVMVSTVTNRDLIGAMEADANEVKVKPWPSAQWISTG